MTKREHPKVGTKFGMWEVIGTEYVKAYPSAKYKYGVLVKCKHTQKACNYSQLLDGVTTGCQKCSGEKKFKGVGNLAMSYVNSLQIGATKRGLEFSVSVEYLWMLFVEQGGFCKFTNQEITLDRFHSVNYSIKKHTQTASLDRIDSSKGYIEGNLQWVHKVVNMMKKDMSDEVFLGWCKLITNNN